MNARSVGPSGADPSSEPRLGRGLRAVPRWGAYLLLAAVATVAVPLLPQAGARTAAFLALQLSSVAAVAVGIRRNRPADQRAWWYLAAALACATLASLLRLGGIGPGPDAFPSASDALQLMQYPFLAMGLVRLVGRGDGRRPVDSLLDAGILTVGLASASWTFVIHPLLEAERFTPLARTVALSYALADLLVLATVAWLVCRTGLRSRYSWLLAAALAAMLAGDGLHHSSIAAFGEVYNGAVPQICWLLWSVCTGAAALHPSMGLPTRRRANGHFGRMATFVVLALLGPVMMILGVALARVVGDGYGWQDAVIPATLSALLAVLLVLRLGTFAGMAHSRAAAFAAQADELGEALRAQEELQRQLCRHTLYDPLTGTANRVLLQERLERAMTRPGADSIHVLMLDLDGFKEVNDTLGHAAGDELLAEVSMKLMGALDSWDTLARVGADEFAVLVEDATPQRAEQLARELLDGMRAGFTVAGRRLPVTACIGVLTVSAPATASEALRDASLALDAARRAGRNQVVVFEQTLRRARLDHARLTSGLRRAIAGDEFSLAFQPVVGLDTGRIRAVETLLRWVPPDGEAIGPNEFVPVAEETGLITTIGSWVLMEACTHARRWWDSHGISVTVNVSGHQLRDPRFPAIVRGALQHSGLPGEALVIEITESTLIAETASEANEARARLNQIRELGVRVAIDDFGTGYSSLSYLRHLPVDILKIDKAFLETDPDAATQERAFIRAIVQLAESLRLQTIAEGIETVDQAQVLQMMDCQLGQGFLFHRPMSARSLDDLLTDAREPATVTAA